jgi:hypothetical protein
MHAPLKPLETVPTDGRSARNAPVGAVRAFLTLLVIAHHAVLTYHPYAPPPKAFTAPPILWTAFPVVDPQRFGGFGLLTVVNDLFFMSLMFLVSGLFVAASLKAKGPGGFLKGRALRLGVPFVVGAGLLAPLAYYPAWLQSGGAPSLAAYAEAWTSLPFWPSGPAWFLWVLLAFGVDRRGAGWPVSTPGPGAGPLDAGRRPAAGTRLPDPGRGQRPGLCAAEHGPALRPLDAGGTVPDPDRPGRPLPGLFPGRPGVRRGGRGPGTDRSARGAGPALVGLADPADPGGDRGDRTFIIAFSPNPPPKPVLDVVGGLAFVLACATLSFAVLAVFLRFVRKTGPLGRSLQANAYGMYLTHYVFTAWLGWLLLPQDWGGLAKGLVAFGGAVVLSWLTTMALRRMPLLGRIL